MNTYYIFTLGCQMNKSDSERLASIFDSMGMKEGKESEADLIVVNACSVRQKPIDRIWGKLKVWQKINPQAKKILTGCVLESDLKKFKKKFDLVFKIDRFDKLIAWLEKDLAPNNLDKMNDFSSYLEIIPCYQKNKQALVPIMTGCNNFCSYCAVPYTRGKEWSRQPNDIIAEVKCLVDKGYEEIILLGQNVCSYRNPKSKILPTQRSGSRIAARIGTNPKQIQNPKVKIKNNDFSELLRRLVKIKGDFTISFMSPHPKDFSDELIDLIASEPKISKEIHLPLQSGDDKILRKMNRGYTVEQYLKLINKLELKIRGLRLSTDIIVGFPGEKEKNFRNTVKVVKDSYFAKAYISIYSPRPGTMADKKFKDTISASTKRERWLLLDKMINQKRLYKN